jgi:hypothetical protein
VKSRAMTGILAERSEEKRRVGEALIREADNLACQSWNEKMWSGGGPAALADDRSGDQRWIAVRQRACSRPPLQFLPVATVGQSLAIGGFAL